MGSTSVSYLIGITHLPGSRTERVGYALDALLIGCAAWPIGFATRPLSCCRLQFARTLAQLLEGGAIEGCLLEQFK
jgi:hypothetical protein